MRYRGYTGTSVTSAIMRSHEKSRTPSIKHRARPGMRAGSLAAGWPEAATPLPPPWFVWFTPVCQRRLMFSFVGSGRFTCQITRWVSMAIEGRRNVIGEQTEAFFVGPSCDGGVAHHISVPSLQNRTRPLLQRCSAACYLACLRLNSDSEARCEGDLPNGCVQ